MARYADIDVLLEHLTASDEGNFRSAITQWLEMHQVEDVALVVHAHWIERQLSERGEYEFCCSNCEHTNYGYDNPGNYCPNCGAKMGEVTG